MKLTKEEIEAIENAEKLVIIADTKMTVCGFKPAILTQLLEGAEILMDKLEIDKAKFYKAMARECEGEEKNGSKKQFN